MYCRPRLTRSTEGGSRLTALCAIALLSSFVLSACSGPTNAASNLSGHVRAAGSTALQPLVAQAAQLFMQEHPAVQIDVAGGGSLSGLNAVTGQQADIGDSDVYADPATYPDPRLTDHLVCVVPFAMMVNPDVTVPSLTRDQIIKIFSTGEITNWKQVGGPDLAIVPIVRPATSGTRATFRKYVLEGRDENGRLLSSDSSQTVHDAVAKTPGAIGYLALAYADSAVHVVAMDGLQPTAENIGTGRYVFWGYEHMYTLGDNGGPVEAFLDFMLTPAIQRLAQQLSYIPLSAMQSTG
jgi:phosphate transport system substrate-binding protein